MNSALRGFISGPDFYVSAQVDASLSPVPVNTSLVRDFCGGTHCIWVGMLLVVFHSTVAQQRGQRSNSDSDLV